MRQRKEAPADTTSMLGSHDILWIVLDTLRHDVAQEAFLRGETPHLAGLLPATGWEKRHSPGNFTFAAHQAFFAGFWPTPARPGRHARRFAMRFEGSDTTAPGVTCVLDAPDLVHGLAARGYHTACVGGVGFFNRQNPLGSVLPGYFAESHWSVETGVTDPRSFEHQIDVCAGVVARTPGPLFLFVNVAALHQPNHFYLPGGGHGEDSLASHAAALRHVDSHLPRLLALFAGRRPTFTVVCSDHGTAYGEAGYRGHRVAHPVVWEVPYTELVLEDGA
jgi:hypothetical protein